ncbi:EamA/RhaT family transporter [Oleiagrimonas sp. C23AA]|uniref:EamA/RhaT family transporter n=1 Tax=Oleiagrimonas sp. C23AA TaxID=2719047 RepID=UPI00142215F4|nr:EamA/RhaT family transporter [Oleiagrimonas sp. C23AA]NII10384.1 EamA/RhaT family transporter [Oleiagrimonas sp. C23AA]
MHFIALSVLFSVAVSVLLRLARRFDIDVGQAVAINYAVAAVLSVLLLHAPVSPWRLAPGRHFVDGWPVFVGLAILLPSIFMALAHSVRRVGVARTDAAQRLSLILPLMAAFTLFGEAWSWLRGAGLMLGLLAVGLLLRRGRIEDVADHAPRRGDAWWPALVFVGMGVIDILFKQLAQLSDLPYTSAMLAVFALSFVVAALALLVQGLRGCLRLGWRHGAAGVALGALNFGNILFYIQGHRALPEHPAMVFAGMNIGVLAVGTLVGVWGFGERLSPANRVGLALAAVAVLVLTAAV